MKDFRFTSRRPRHIYKTARFLLVYRNLKDQDSFIRPSKGESYMRKIIMLKKMFMWYYNISSVTVFRKIFSHFFARKRYNFRTALSFFHLLEKNILVLLVRMQFSRHLPESMALVRSGLVFINGIPITYPIYFTKIGDIIEVMKWQQLLLIHYRNLLFFFDDFLHFRLNYLLNQKLLMLSTISPTTAYYKSPFYCRYMFYLRT